MQMAEYGFSKKRRLQEGLWNLRDEPAVGLVREHPFSQFQP